MLGAAWIMQLAGLTMGLGAFLAGVLLADSEFRHELEAQIKPFEGLLLGLFFIAIGMTINVPAVLADPYFVGIGVAVADGDEVRLLYGIGRSPGGLPQSRFAAARERAGARRRIRLRRVRRCRRAPG